MATVAWVERQMVTGGDGDVFCTPDTNSSGVRSSSGCEPTWRNGLNPPARLRHNERPRAVNHAPLAVNVALAVSVALAVQRGIRMSLPMKPVARSYDEIIRRTVPELDSSFRPSPQQEKAAYEGTRILDEDEQRLYARVVDALLDVGDLDPSGISVEIDRDRVTLHGRVTDPGAMDRIERRVEEVEGVGVVASLLVVGSA